MVAAVGAVVPMEAAEAADITVEEEGTRVIAAVAVLTGAPAEQLRAHSQGRALMGIAATHTVRGLTARMAADLRQAQRRVVPARLCRRGTPATLEIWVTAAPETPLRGIADQPRHQHSLAIQDRRQQVLDQPSVEIAEAGQPVRLRDHPA
jgi:hypothetical protein